MNWQSISFDWNQARAFLATAEEGSLSAAARALGQTQPTVGRQVAALERALDVVLFERIGRSLTLTQSGMELLTHVQTMRDAATHMSLTASGQSQAVEGLVRITASDIMSAYVLPPVIKELRETEPLLEIEIIAANDIRDLQRREADIAIRHVRPTQPDLITKLVAEPTAHCYASTAYLDRYGTPRTAKDLKGHHFLSFGDASEMLSHLTPLGFDLTRENFRLGSESGVVSWEMARAGLGIAIMSDGVAESAPGMQRIVTDMQTIVFPTWLTTHRELHTSRRIRLVYDRLDAFLSRETRI